MVSLRPLAIPVMQTIPVIRKCGNCHVCCTIMGVQSVGKAAGERCKHLVMDNGEKHCGLGDDRPEQCKQFQCQLTIDEDFPIDLRPEKSNVVAFTNSEGLGFHVLYAADFYRSRFRKLAKRFEKNGTKCYLTIKGVKRQCN